MKIQNNTNNTKIDCLAVETKCSKQRIYTKTTFQDNLQKQKTNKELVLL